MSTRTVKSLALLFLFSVISAPTTRPQADNQPRKSSDSLMSDRERTSRKETNDEWSRREPRDGEEWFRRGYELHSSDRYPEAIEAFKHAVDLGYRKATAMYNIACGYSLLNDKDNALAWLQRALNDAFSRTDLLASDSDLDPLRADPRFKKILASVPGDNNRDRPGKEQGYEKPDRLEQANLDFARLDREASSDGTEWAKVGLHLLRLRVLERAVIALNQAVAHLDYKGATAMYNLACSYALRGDRDAGIHWLEKSVNSGFDGSKTLRNDPDIASLRADPRFPRIELLSDTLSLSQFYKNTDGSVKSDSFGYSKQRWAPAIEIYESFVRSEPNNGRAWFNLGYALHYSHEHERAIQAFEHARRLGYNRPTSMYNIACAYSMLNQRDLAFEWLDRAADEGYELNGYITGDRDLDNLRSDLRFKRFTRIARKATAP